MSARVLATVGLVAGFIYLAWRASASLAGAPLWLSVPFLAVEIVGFLGAATLVWALWPMPVPARGVTAHPDPDGPSPLDCAAVDAVVRVHHQREHEVRATLLSLRSVAKVHHVVLVDHSGRPSMAALATEFQAVYAAPDTEDQNGLRVITAAVRTAQFLLVDAGDVPASDIVTRLSVELRDPSVAVVQGLGVSLADDSPEHGPNRRHELTFERSSLNPSLGRRRVAVWLGSGSIVRTDALRKVPMGNERSLEAHWTASTELMRAGWSIVAPADVAVVTHRTISDDTEVYRDRVDRARSARLMVFGDRGVLRTRNFTVEQRLAVLAWAVRPLSGLRRVAFIALLCAALLSGQVPFTATAFAMAIVWVPWFLYTGLGLSLLSGWTLRPGDRTRWSLHNIGASFNGLHPQMPTRGAPRKPIISLPANQYGSSLVVAVVVLSVVLVLRGLSEQVTHTLGELPHAALVAMLTTALWMLALSLDLLRVLARRAQMRRAPRVVAALAATLGERAVSIVDLTALGAGVFGHTGFDVGEALMLDSSIPTRTGVTSMSVPVVVRNVSLLSGEGANAEWRIGVEFGEVDDATANALAEFCTIEPMWERMGVLPGSSITEPRPLVPIEDLEPAPSAGRMAVRLVSLFALVGAIASSVPTRVDATETFVHAVGGAVVTADSGQGVADAVVTVVCATDAGADLVWGTSDDTFTTPVSGTSDAEGLYRVAVNGDACWSAVSPPQHYIIDDPTAPLDQLEALDLGRGSARARTVEVQATAAQPSPTAVTGAAVGDSVWNDENGNGVRDQGELGVGGVTITLFDQSGQAVGRRVTDDAGRFRFDGLGAGAYSISATNLPQGMTFTQQGVGVDRTVDSDANPVTGRTPLVAVTPGDDMKMLDVGVHSGDSASSSGATAAKPEMLFPAPLPPAPAGPDGVQSLLTVLVLALVAMIATSILIGLTRPRRRIRV